MRAAFVLVSVLAALASAQLQADPARPTLPNSYHMTYILSVNMDLPPYSNGTGEQWVDAVSGMTRTQTQFQMVQTDIIGDYTNHVFYSNQCVTPPQSDPLCYCRQLNDSAPFPNLDLSKTTFEGIRTVNGRQTYAWFTDSGAPDMSIEFYADINTNQIVRIIEHLMSGDTVIDVQSFDTAPFPSWVFNVGNATASWECQPALAVVAAPVASTQKPETLSAMELLKEIVTVREIVPISAHPLSYALTVPHLLRFDWCTACKELVPNMMNVLCGAGGAVICAATTLGAPACALIVGAICVGGHATCAGFTCGQIACRAARFC